MVGKQPRPFEFPPPWCSSLHKFASFYAINLETLNEVILYYCIYSTYNCSVLLVVSKRILFVLKHSTETDHIPVFQVFHFLVFSGGWKHCASCSKLVPNQKNGYIWCTVHACCWREQTEGKAFALKALW